MAGMKKIFAAGLFAAQIKRGNLCVFTVFGQATAIYAWLGRRKRHVTWEMAEKKKFAPRELFAAQIKRGNLSVFSVFGQATANFA